jgi:hypothetical protein
MKKILLTIAISVLLLPTIALAAVTAPNITTPSASPATPGLNFGAANLSGGAGNQTVSTPWLGDYIGYLYEWMIGIIAILAAVSVAIGGVLWITAAGNRGQITEAKSWITSALFGLAIGLGAYLILNTINPNLTTIGNITASYIEPQDPNDYDFGSYASYNKANPGTPGKPFATKFKSVPLPTDTSLQGLIDFYMKQDRVLYSQEAGFRGNNVNGQTYFDCSSFAEHLAAVAGLNRVPGEGWTRGLFLDASNNRQPLTNLSSPDSYLKPGDLVGYYDPNEKTKKGTVGVGHVLTYIGHNRLIECGGESGTSVIQRNGDVKIVDFNQRLSGYNSKNLYYIKR